MNIMCTPIPIARLPTPTLPVIRGLVRTGASVCYSPAHLIDAVQALAVRILCKDQKAPWQEQH